MANNIAIHCEDITGQANGNMTVRCDIVAIDLVTGNALTTATYVQIAFAASSTQMNTNIINGVKSYLTSINFANGVSDNVKLFGGAT